IGCMIVLDCVEHRSDNNDSTTVAYLLDRAYDASACSRMRCGDIRKHGSIERRHDHRLPGTESGEQKRQQYRRNCSVQSEESGRQGQPDDLQDAPFYQGAQSAALYAGSAQTRYQCEGQSKRQYSEPCGKRGQGQPELKIKG